MVVGAFGLGLSAAGYGVLGIGHGASTAVMLLATALSWTAARLFCERRPMLLLVLAGPVLWLATLPLESTWFPWAALSCGIGALYTLATAFEIWRTRPDPLPSRRLALILLLGHAGLYGARAAMALAGSGPPSELLGTAFILEGLVQTNGMAFLLLAMVKERIELRSNQQLRTLTRLDGLTGIGNRRHFDEQLDIEIRRSGRRGIGLALLLIDVDHFKSYNDAVGHQQGDARLRDVAQSIARHVRRTGDLAARYGGEEFAVILANTDQQNALDLAERMRASVAAMAVEHPGIGGIVTISIGVAVMAPEQTTSAQLVRQADQALYYAKAHGRNSVQAAWRLVPDVPQTDWSGAPAAPA